MGVASKAAWRLRMREGSVGWEVHSACEWVGGQLPCSSSGWRCPPDTLCMGLCRVC